MILLIGTCNQKQKIMIIIKEIVSTIEFHDLLRENDWIYCGIAKAFVEHCSSFNHKYKDFLLQIKYLFY